MPSEELQKLNESLVNCKSCSLCKTRTKVVLGSGNSKAKIILVGEAPGASEDLKGEPFIGKAGDVLNHLLKESGFKRDELYFTNCCRCRPPKNRKPSNQEISACSKYFDEEIKTIKPEWIIALGETAMLRLVGYANIASRHGNVTWSERHKCNIFLSYHPATVLYRPRMQFILLNDFKVLYKKIFEKEEKHEVKKDLRFVHLHVHDHFSFLDGLGKTEDFVAKAKSFGHIALAQTNHRSISGAIRFVKACNKERIKPILGCEFDFVDDMNTKGIKREDSKKLVQQTRYHLTALAKNIQGYKNLIRLVTISNVEGFYYRPRLDLKTIAKYKEGLIFMTACLKGRINSAILKDENPEKVIDIMRKYLGKFILEIMPNDLDEQKKVNLELVRLSEKFQLPLVATVDTHFIEKDYSKTHEILLQIQTRNLTGKGGLKFHSKYFWFMGADEVLESFKNNHPGIPENIIQRAMENTVKIANKVEEIKMDFKPVKEAIPSFPVPGNQTTESFFKSLIKKGWKERNFHKLNKKEVEVYRDRLVEEYSQLKSFGLLNYFLIVWDMIRWCKESNIRCGAGRGSAAGSLVSYLLGITNIDPIKFGLLFSRFISPERYAVQYDFGFKDFTIDEWKKKAGLI